MKKQDKLNNSNAAVVLGLGITGLGVIRNLGRNGIPIIGVDCDPLAIAVSSRYCTKKFIYDKTIDRERLVEYLKVLAGNTNGKSVLIPAEDKYVRFVSEHRKELENYFIFVIPDKELCDAIMNKRLFYNLALKHDTPVPRTFFPQSEDNGIASIAQKVNYPCIIKPVYSKEWDFASTLKAITAFGPDNLIDKYRELLTHNGTEIIIQEIVPGYDDQQYSLCTYFNRDSQPLAVFVARKLRQHPTGFGVGTYVESAQEPEVERLGIDFLKKIKYKGIAEVEFKKDSRDGKFKMIEINARSWTQNTLPTKSGINIVYLLFLDALGKAERNNLSYKTEVKWFNIFRDLFASFQYMRQKELSLKKWIESLKGVKEFSDFSYDDPLPFIYFPIYSASRLFKDRVLKIRTVKP